MNPDQLTPQQALNILSEAITRVQATFPDHIIMRKSFDIIQGIVLHSLQTESADASNSGQPEQTAQAPL